jgi:pimeloyl-ACP methyl ester carboxylesterase
VALRWLVDSARGSIAEALDGLTAFLRKYIAFPDPRLAVLAAAWALLTWCYRAFDTIPYLGIHAPVKRAGKTHCLDLLRLVSFNVTAIIVAPTETQLYREVEQTAGAQFFDEVDKFASDHDRWDAFIGSFNQGYQRGASANERSVTASELTLLCLHGNSSHRGVWRLVVRQLSEYRSVLVDFRGHGESEHVSPPAYNPEHHAEDLAEVVPKLVQSPYAILAHSAGALAATRFMTRTAPLTSALMPTAFVWVDLDPLVPRWQVDYFHQGVASVARIFPTIDDALRGFRRIYPNIPEDRLRSFVIEGLRQVDGGWRMKLDPGTYGTWEPGDLRPHLPRVTCPTLVLRGADSIVTSAEGVTALSTGLPSCEVREIKGGSHMVLLEHPDEVARTIRQFLGAHAPPAQ